MDKMDKEELELFLRENVLTTKDLTELLDMTNGGISWLVNEGKLTPFKKQKNCVLFSRQEVERYLREKKKKA